MLGAVRHLSGELISELAKTIVRWSCSPICRYHGLVLPAKAGDLNKRDCAAGSQGCVKDSTGHPALDRDCVFERVGEPLIAMHTSWPISPGIPYSVINSLSWSVANKVKLGVFAKREKQFEALWQTSRCPARTSGSNSLQVKQIWGGAALAVAFALVGVAFDVVNRHSKAAQLPQTDQPPGAPKDDLAQSKMGNSLNDMMEMMLKVHTLLCTR